LYLTILFLVLLYPFDFSSPYASRENSVAWLDNANGVQLGKSGMLVSAGPPVALFRQLISGEGLTIELWLSSASANQGGPARIISYSLNPWERNFTLGQQGNDLIMRLRTTKTDANGTPSLDVANVFIPGKMQHIVVVYDFVEERIYVDGSLRAASALHQGNFKTWDPSYFLVLGNEVSGARPWNGVIAYAAIYERPLPDNAVAAKYNAGYPPSNLLATAGRLLAYKFEHGMQGLESGSDTLSTIFPMPRLEKPARVATYSRLFFLRFGGKMMFEYTSAWDLIRNVILFVPFGVFGFAFVERRTRSTTAAVLMTVIGASLVSAMCEALQIFLAERTSSILDLGTNAAGALVGAVGCYYWFLRGGMRR
jgi:hypothetical protein